MGRVRSKDTGQQRHYFAYGDSSSDGPYQWPPTLSEYFWESKTPGPCNCYHLSLEPYVFEDVQRCNEPDNCFTVEYGPATGFEASQTPSLLDVLGSQLYSSFLADYSRLQWESLPTSNQAGLIQMIAELDETLALFTEKFWHNLSYGSLNWGVLPFISDIKSIFEIVSKLDANLSSYVFETALTSQDLIEDSMFRGSYEARIGYTGRLSFATVPEWKVFLDRLGFHPDVATVWDLVPLSFLVDYLLPVGDWLESLSGRGWVDSLTFTGWHTAHVTFQTDRKVYTTHSDWEPLTRGKAFLRYSRDTPWILNTDPSDVKLLNFERPTLRQLFNTLYVLRSR